MKSLLIILSDDNVGNAHSSGAVVGGKNSMLSEEIMMILSTRPRENNVSDVLFVNSSILNYGVSDVFEHGVNAKEIATILALRIKMALVRFETRLRDIQVIAESISGTFYFFVIQARSNEGAVSYRVMWDNVINRFSLLE
ncbi:GPW/gp25 family protein [Serratia liquefaciens]|uniref:hypothetical protein n=1 Tax=Serratia liquefaciens TaxID=614 RepID=UPI00165D0246|nr:hypothetical protein [Serratia liquefaciens]QNQ55452.1 hypothetical protein IAI46_05545 [Serratia liquefaciens]